jgi:serine kinase
VAKWIRNADGAEVAFRAIKYSDVEADAEHSPDNLRRNIEAQVKILKLLSNRSRDIIDFHGLVMEPGSQQYLVTEWATYGNLRDYYRDHHGTLNWKTKLLFALSICRALRFLHHVSVFHHDVRSDNVMITEHSQAKLANFGLSRMFNEATMNVKQNAENVRYMAPEKFTIGNRPYDVKCEIYRFVDADRV